MNDAPQFRSGALTYFAAVLAWSTAGWLASPYVTPGLAPEASPIFLLGGAGPLILAVALTHLREAPVTQRDFWVRIVDPRRMSLPWFATALLLHPAIVLVAWFASMGLGDVGTAMPRQFGAVALLSLAFFTFWFGPLPEEIGWRGYALDRLLAKHSALSASVIIGVVWALWHVPLFFVPGTFQHELGLDSVRFWIFSATLVPLSILMTWVYNNTERSTLSAAIVHFSGNFCGALIVKSDQLALIELVLLCICAGIVVARFGAQNLRRSGNE